jgi:hypothetical protein
MFLFFLEAAIAALSVARHPSRSRKEHLVGAPPAQKAKSHVPKKYRVSAWLTPSQI